MQYQWPVQQAVLTTCYSGGQRVPRVAARWNHIGMCIPGMKMLELVPRTSLRMVLNIQQVNTGGLLSHRNNARPCVGDKLFAHSK
jgi:hypothetical protein